MYRPCKFRTSQLGIFQCEKHQFIHTSQDHYSELYNFCKDAVPDRFCTYVDFGFSMEGEKPKIFVNCTHPYQSRPLNSINDCFESCDYFDKEGDSLG